MGDRVKWEDSISAFESRIRTGIITNFTHIDVRAFLMDSFALFKTRVKNVLKKFPMLKINTTFCGEFLRKSCEKELRELKYFNTKNHIVHVGVDLAAWFNENIVSVILAKVGEFQERDSGWALERIISLVINLNKFEVGNGSSFIGLPEQISRKKACVNVKNMYDDACFMWSVVSALYPADINPDRTSSYPHYSTVLNLDNLEIPMPIQKIPKFEKLNQISINVYALELNKTKNREFFSVVPALLTKSKMTRHVNLLMIQNQYFPNLNDYDAPPADTSDDGEIKYHYVWIKDLSRLISSQMIKHRGRIFICDRCLNYFLSQIKLNDHTIDCESLNKCKISFPNYNSVKFKNFTYKEKVPFVIYADFESMLIPINENTSSSTIKYQKHEAFSAGYYFKCSYDDRLSYFKSHRGSDCMDWFAGQLEEIAKVVESKIVSIVPMTEFPNRVDATHCHICEQPFTPEKNFIVRDHCHFTGNFRGFAHQQCNLNYRKLFMVPIVFHNLSGYDSHFIIRDIAKRGKVSLLPINKEKYISFTQVDENTNIKFRFIDSFRFMGASLDELASIQERKDLKNLNKEFANLDPSTLTLLTRKGVFPYDHIDSMKKLDETTLPPIDKFYNKLNDSNITPEEYTHAEKVWNTFHCQNLGEYSDIYLKTDVMLLADVFENFRALAHATYGLCPAWYYTMPGYTWDCMLKYTKCELEILHDVDMVLFVEKGIRGGISQCCNRFSEANNKYMSEYDPAKPSKYLLYLDANNLYGWAQCEPLPYGGFKWIDDVENFDVTAIPNDSPVGYFLEVDLHYPESLHDKHADLPLCAEHRVPPGSKLPKLMTTLYDKEKYVLHYRNLKMALANGLQLTKIHRVLQFKQSTWLKPYIDLNTNLRTKATSAFAKNNYKLANNANFGKTMENVRKHRNVKLVSKWEGRYGAKNLIASPNFHNRTIFDENLMAIELSKTNIVFNKPLYVGMAILDLSKICMYDFHYGYMMKKFDTKELKLMYTDTDSFIYEIHCDDVYENVIKADIANFDTSDYPKNNIFNIPLLNKKVPGLMKDETNGSIMTHFVGLRSKMYTFQVAGGHCVKKSKGVKMNVVKTKISFNDYLECLKNSLPKFSTQRTIRSIAHKVYSVEQEKISLSPHDDKRYLIPGSHDTLPWGHCSIKQG